MIFEDKYCSESSKIWRKYMVVEQVVLAISYLFLAIYYILLTINILM